MKLDSSSFVASFRHILISHHVLCFQHFLHEFLFFVHNLEVAAIDVGELLLHDLVGHGHRLLGRLEDVVVAPQPVHWEDLGV